jgi:hypothetical protein
MLKQDLHIFTGMQRDLAVSRHKAEFLWNAHNIRLTAREGDTLLAMTNERGTAKAVDNSDNQITMNGIYLGHCVLNKYLIVFIKDNTKDYIYRIEGEDIFNIVELYSGNLNFSFDHPIETLGIYENQFIQKVYWVDGNNQPRVINITKDKLDNKIPEYNNDSFNFVKTLDLSDKLYIVKEASNIGLFPAGVIQYAITYYNKYGQESNISQVSPLLSTSFLDRGGSPEEKMGNSFKIHIENPDKGFDFVRIYSIFRTSINATPTVKIVKDINILDSNSYIEYTDNNEGGESIDPTILLYVGGESIIANTMTQKDNTLFLGNIQISRSSIPNNIKESIRGKAITFNTRSLELTNIGGEYYRYANTLNAKTSEGYSDNPIGFMKDEHYKFGVQFQHSNGKWSEPVLIDNATNTVSPNMYFTGNLITLNVPQASCILDNLDITTLQKLGYKRARGVVVLPSLQDRIVVAKGMLCPTVYNIVDRINNAPYVQSSWFLRPFPGLGSDTFQGITDGTIAQYHHYKSLHGGNDRSSEIQGVPQELSNIDIGEKGDTVSNIGAKGVKSPNGSVYIKDDYKDNPSNYHLVNNKYWGNIYGVDQSIVTLHSPDIEFDDNFASLNYSEFNFNIVGSIKFQSSFGDINITTSSPPIAGESGGFQHRTLSALGIRSAKSLISGLFYEDFLVDEVNNATKYIKYSHEGNPWLYMIYPWHKSGSLNNDAVRPANTGARSAVLKRKVISNIKFSNTNSWKDKKDIKISKIFLFNSDQVTALKLGDKIYYGNVDTIVTPVYPYGSVFSTGGSESTLWDFNQKPSFEDTQLFFSTKNGIYPYPESPQEWYGKASDHIGKEDTKLRVTKENIRMKYKTTAHVVFSLKETNLEEIYEASFRQGSPSLLIGELTRSNTSNFEKNDEDSLKNCLWTPAGDSVPLTTNMTIVFKYGDTYYQKYDCLKTYPFTLEDSNSIVEIGSFMCETRINIDGRYDKNEGNISNLNVLNTNFNKINPVYTQRDTFFNYRILDKDYYKISKYSSSIAWTKTKSSASDIDLWTNITLANILDLDGDKGEITSLNTYNDNIFCFQQQGISNILFNSRVQIPTSDGVPIEISNNYKVEGKRYLSENLGCTNKWSIQVTPSGIYFIESNNKALYHLSDKGFTSVSDSHGMSNFFNTFSKADTVWRPDKWVGIKSFYDRNHNDLYISDTHTSINFSDTLGQFISFFDYGGVPAMFNIGNEFYAITNSGSTCSLWKMFKGDYNNFFGKLKPYDFTFISNSNESADKIFTNLILRADFYQDGVDRIIENDGSITITPYKNRLDNKLFFDYIQVYNEYQDTGKVPLTFKNSKPSNLKKKFRLWALDIPRDKDHKLDRIRNNWTYIKLGNNTVKLDATDNEKANSSLGSNKHMVLHDVTVNFHI